MNKYIEIFFSSAFSIASVFLVLYNAYNHNWQLMLLWLSFITQSLALGGVLSQIKNND